MSYPKITLKSREDQRILQGHLWVFSNELEKVSKDITPGQIVDLYSHRGQFLGRGFYNARSLIAARILTRKEEPIDEAFVLKRIQNAQKYRESIYPNEESYRLLFGESDLMPGLVIDRYQDLFVVQSNCLGMDLLMPMIEKALKELFSPRCIVLKNDSPYRELEGVPEEVRILSGEMRFPKQFTKNFREQKIQFQIDPLQGQKSGYFFDQKENRERVASFSKDKNVLDCFSYSGGFGIYALKGGASKVTFVDASEWAIRSVEENLQLNGLSGETIAGDVFEILEKYRSEKRKFDIIVLDPPAFAKTKKNLFGALRKYGKLNELALQILNTGGILVSSSCSHHIRRDDFIKMIGESLAEAGRAGKIIEISGASKDHPIMASMPETEYLKCVTLKTD